MTKIFINNNRVLSLNAISSEEDLKPAAHFDPPPHKIINPPPADGRCQVCGRHISELKPFGGPGDPLVGNFKGELLVKRWRCEGPYDEEAEKAWDEAEKVTEGKPESGDLLPWFIGRYGEEKGERLYWGGMLSASSRPSWECRDCTVLDEDEYFEKLNQRYQKSRNE